MVHFVAREHLQDIRKKWRKWDPNNRNTLHEEKRKNDEPPNDIDEPEFIKLGDDEYYHLFPDEKRKNDDEG